MTTTLCSTTVLRGGPPADKKPPRNFEIQTHARFQGCFSMLCFLLLQKKLTSRLGEASRFQRTPHNGQAKLFSKSTRLTGMFCFDRTKWNDAPRLCCGPARSCRPGVSSKSHKLDTTRLGIQQSEGPTPRRCS